MAIQVDLKNVRANLIHVFSHGSQTVTVVGVRAQKTVPLEVG